MSLRAGQLAFAAVLLVTAACAVDTARADEASAQANYTYAKSTAARWQQMLKTQSVSQQDTDTRVADMQAKAAALEAAITKR